MSEPSEAIQRKDSTAENEPTRCAFCKRLANHTITTGVSAYESCHPCTVFWEMSDHTREALQELRVRGAAPRLLEALEAAYNAECNLDCEGHWQDCRFHDWEPKARTAIEEATR